MPSTKATIPARKTTRAKNTATGHDPATRHPSKSTSHDARAPKRPSKAVPPPATEDEMARHMRAVNLSLQNLSAVVQSGWKWTPSEAKARVNTFATTVDDAISSANKSLEKLRDIIPDGTDVERAACGITGKLIALGMYEEAIQFLDGMYPRLLRISGSTHLSSGSPPPLHLLSLPHPPLDDPVAFTLLMTSLAHALSAIPFLLLRSSPPFSIDTLVTTLRHSHSLLAWAAHTKRDNIPEKTRDGTLTKAYTFIDKVCATLSSGGRANVDAMSIMQLRIYALSCLLYTASDTIKSTTFWDQVHKACICCARTLSSEPMAAAKESALSGRISSSLSELVTLTQSVRGFAFLEGRSFVQMCETWMKFAQKGDVAMLDRISELIGISPSSQSGAPLKEVPVPSSCSVDSLVAGVGKLKLSESTTPQGTEAASCHGSRDDVLVDCARWCAILVKVTASLDNEGPELVRHIMEATDAVRRYGPLVSSLDSFSCPDRHQHSTLVQDSTSQSSTINAEVVRARGKLERALERIRRAGLRVLDASKALDQVSTHAMMTLLEAVANALEGSLTQRKSHSGTTTEVKDVLTSFVDVLFSLARSQLRPADVETYTLSLSYLERAMTAVDAASITTADAATFLRCISGTLHNLGGTLYAADRLGGAVRFLKEGCALGKRVLTMYTHTEHDTDREREGRQQLEEQLFRRYELLGVCHSKIGDRKLAYACFVDSVRTFPYTHHLSSFSSAEPFGPDAPLALKQLSSIVDRLTYTATCEIFLPPAEITLRLLFSAQSESVSTVPPDDRSRAEISGAILTRQLATLENMGHKHGVRDATGRLLEDLLSVYDASWAPVQRARVLVTALGVSWREDSDAVVDDIGRDALGLLTREGEDLALLRQLRAAVHMWLALHAYRRAPEGSEMMTTVARHVDAACGVFGGLTGPETDAHSKGPTSAGKSAPQRRANRGRAGVDVKRSAARARQVGGVSPNTVSLNLQPLLGLIQMNVHVLGLLGLVLLKVRLLEVLARLCERQTPIPAQAYAMVCVALAQEYVALGKPKRARALFDKCAGVVQEVSDEMRVAYLLGHAEALARADDVVASARAYREAQQLDESVPADDKTMASATRVRMRVEQLERAALACRAAAAVQHAQDDVTGALGSLLQALRLWNRAADALSRLRPRTDGQTAEDENPFDTPTQPKRPPSPTDALAWRLLVQLVSTLFALAQAYHVRGSPREALYFVHQVVDLAESTRAQAVVARASLLRGEVLLRQGSLGEGQGALERAATLLGGTLGIDAADAERLEGDYAVLRGVGERGDPGEHYERAWQMLDELARRVGSIDGGQSSIGPTGGQGMVMPHLLSAILCRHIWLLRSDGDDVVKELFERLMSLPQSAETKGEEHAVMAKLTLHGVYEQFRSDMFLSSLTESTIALPMGVSGDKSVVPATQDIVSALEDAERLFWADLALMVRRGTVTHVREASVSLAMIRALQSSLGKTAADAPLLATRLLDASSAITLHREMLEAISYKLSDMHTDDLEWPAMTEGSARRRSGTNVDEDARAYWSALETKYKSLVLSPSGLLETAPKLPDHWTVIHITLTPDQSSMFISRLCAASSEPLLFCIPLRGRRDAEEEDAGLMLDDALDELREIVRLSDEGTRRAAQVQRDDLQARAGWWAERAALDKRLKALLENIEFCWLGAFKTILSPPTTLSKEVIGDLRVRLEKLFKRLLPQDKKKRTFRVEDSLLGCFSSLPPTCRDEELEDVVYFMLDLYQLHGVPIATSEVDMDQVTVDLRHALEEHATARKRAKVVPVEDGHIFLVLDRRLQGIPWESIPVLRGQSVSRIPSLEFLLDRVELARMQRGSGDGMVDRICVDIRKTYYVLNPSGDLKGTEGRFSSWLREMHGMGWDGIVGRAPSEQELLDALSRKDLVIYFGHGGGEQYARSHRIRHLGRCAATMLWGCSSGALKEMGEYDRVGTPYHYMVAGCPTLIANLWDVTDRDIDTFTAAVFDALGLRGGQGTGTSVVRAAARARDACKLRYLTGAAPVVYGIPFYL